MAGVVSTRPAVALSNFKLRRISGQNGDGLFDHKSCTFRVQPLKDTWYGS